MSVISEIETLLVSVTNLSVGELPATPDNAVSLAASGGYPRSLTGTFMREPTFRIRVRSVSYETGWALCESIIDLLHGKTTTNIPVIQQQSDIVPEGRDSSNRHLFSVTFRTYFKG